jgi:hypothetical protein
MNFESASNAIVAVVGFYAGALAEAARDVREMENQNEKIGEATSRLAEENARLSHRIRQLEAQANVAKQVVDCANKYVAHVGDVKNDPPICVEEELRENLIDVLEGYGDGDASTYNV